MLLFSYKHSSTHASVNRSSSMLVDVRESNEIHSHVIHNTFELPQEPMKFVLVRQAVELLFMFAD